MRRPTDLAEQIALLARFFGSALTADAAASLAPHPSGTHRGGARPTEARFVPVVVALTSAFPPHIIAHARRALLTLPPPQGYVVYLSCCLELPARAIATHLDRSPRQVQRYRAQGLRQLALWLWTDNFEPSLPPPDRPSGGSAPGPRG